MIPDTETKGMPKMTDSKYLSPERREEMRKNPWIRNSASIIALLDHAAYMDDEIERRRKVHIEILEENDAVIAKLKERLSEASDEIESLNGTVVELKERVRELEEEIDEIYKDAAGASR